MPEKDEPYEPKHKGFDAEANARAQATADRAQETAAAKGEGDDAYVEEGPAEAAERLGWSKEDVEESVEDARRRARRR